MGGGDLFRIVVLLFISAQLVFIGQPLNAKVYKTQHYSLQVASVANGLDHPWGMAFLPDGTILVTERNSGTIRLIETNGRVLPPLSNTPRVYSRGQGGMLDIVIDPAYASTRRIYFSYAETEGGLASTTVARGRLNRRVNSLEDFEVIFQQHPKTVGDRHFGSRLIFSPKGHLFITMGERGKRDLTQNFTANMGQVIRINDDGSIPEDNPFVGRTGYRPEIWSVGHRNPQGAALHPLSRELWIHEHGARGGDEINISKPGRNYGWPVIAYGIHYSGAKIGEGTHKKGMEQPIYYWDPSIAPSGMTFYTGNKFAKWKGDVFIGALKYRLLVRLSLDGDKIISEEHILDELNKRVRSVVQGPDENLYILVDENPGQVLRIEKHHE